MRLSLKNYAYISLLSLTTYSQALDFVRNICNTCLEYMFQYLQQRGLSQRTISNKKWLSQRTIKFPEVPKKDLEKKKPNINSIEDS